MRCRSEEDVSLLANGHVSFLAIAITPLLLRHQTVRGCEVSYTVLFSRCDCGTSALHFDTPLGVNTLMRSKYQVSRPENVILWDSFIVPDSCCHRLLLRLFGTVHASMFWTSGFGTTLTKHKQSSAVNHLVPAPLIASNNYLKLNWL